MAVVNWHPDGCSFPKGRLSLEQNLPHRHILWRNDEGMLLRALINHEHVEQMMRYAPGFRRWEQDLHRAATRFLAAKVLEGWRTEWARRHVPTWRLARQAHGLEVGAVAGQREVSTVDFVWGEHTVRVPVTSALCRVWHPDVARTLDPVTGVPRYPNGADGSKWPSDEDFEREQDQCRRELLAVSDGRAAEVIKREEVLRALVALEAFREHWHASHNEIFKVRQVFL